MFFQFGALPYEIPFFIWNSSFFQTVESFQSVESETMIKVNENCQKDDFSQNSEKVRKLTNDGFLRLIKEKL